MKINIKGEKYGRLTVLEQDKHYISPQNGRKFVQWFCKCDCGKHKTVRTQSLRNGLTKSCGCLVSETVTERNKANASKNQYWIVGEIAYFEDSKGRVFFADASDVKKILTLRWYVSTQGYVVSSTTGKHEKLHRYLMDNKNVKGKILDHIDGNKLNNTRKNLRFSTNSENQINRLERIDNTSTATGVHFVKNSEKWIAYLSKNGKRFSLGSYDTFEQAKEARTNAEEEHYPGIKNVN